MEINRSSKEYLQSMVVAKMFRDKQYRTRVVPNKKKESKYERCKETKGGRWKLGVQYEPWET